MTGIDPSTMVGVGKLQQLLHANPDLRSPSDAISDAAEAARVEATTKAQ